MIAKAFFYLFKAFLCIINSASKSAGIYPLEITATDETGNKYTLTVELNLTKTSVQWREI